MNIGVGGETGGKNVFKNGGIVLYRAMQTLTKDEFMRQRFAPSPSGFLHLGHAFSALTIWRAVGGDASRFVLRIEDIDTARCKPAFETAIMEDLHWLGISWADVPLRQSARAGDYAVAVRDLWQRGLVFACDCNRREALAGLSAPQEGDPPIGIYSGGCSRRADRRFPCDIPADMALRLDAGQLPDAEYRFMETGVGEVVFTKGDVMAEFGGCVLARRDIGISYHLAVVLDDAFQEITHVTRGEDLFEQTKLHVVLQGLLGLPTPVYHHHKLIRDAEGKRLAKRDDAVALRVLRAGGASAEDVRARVFND